MESVTPAAPAPPADTTISASRDAANRGDFAAFDAAHLATKKGETPAPVVVQAAVETVDTAPVTDGPRYVTPPVKPSQPSKRELERNENTRRAVDRATADLQAENARLRAQMAPPAAPIVAPDAPPAPPPEAEWKRLASLPRAPKLADFDSVEEHTAAMSWFVNTTLRTEAQQAAQQRAEHDELTGAQRQRVETFVGRLHETTAADPEFVAKLTPEVLALKPFSALQPGEVGSPRNIIAEQLYDSPVAPQVLLHLSQHPEALAALEAMPAAIAALPPPVRTRAHIQYIVKAFAKLEARFESAPTSAAAAVAVPSFTSAAPPPAPILTTPSTTTDPQASALARGDFATFDRLDMAKRVAHRTPA